jgi:hypothetical protein
MFAALMTAHQKGRKAKSSVSISGVMKLADLSSEIATFRVEMSAEMIRSLVTTQLYHLELI